MQHKTCTQCRDCKPLDQFPFKSGSGLHGVASHCLKCCSANNKADYQRRKAAKKNKSA